jgi:hypothetical protein
MAHNQGYAQPGNSQPAQPGYAQPVGYAQPAGQGQAPPQQHMTNGHKAQEDGVGALCCCFDSGPVEGDPYGNGRQTFRTTMCNAPCNDPCCFLMSACYPCAQYSLRKKVLKGDMSRYLCGQGYYAGCCCCKPGKLGEKECPDLCLCCEGFCCPGLAVSASRMVVMDEKGLLSDPCDRRIIRFNNCVQCASCICDILACFVPEFRDAADLLRQVAQIVFCVTQGCMTAQVNYELNQDAIGAPPAQSMK